MHKAIELIARLILLFKNFELANKHIIKKTLLVSLFFYILLYQIFLKAPDQFPVKTMVHIEKGLSLNELSEYLKSKDVITSPKVFKFFVIFLGKDRNVMAGDYLFTEKISLPTVALRMINGEFNLTPVKITIPEGLSREEMSVIFTKNLPFFEKEKFMEETKNDEGYLFPDTYLFFPNVTDEEIISTMKSNFDTKTKTLKDDIRKANKTMQEMLIMASILEKEAHTIEDKKIIAGILWKRIEIGMALQVDAPFVYYNGKGTYNLTTKDLKTDSPYNTYTRKGLPAGPIGNPGLDSILAAIYPKTSPYLFYLSDREGNIYYSANYEKHKKNKILYVN